MPTYLGNPVEPPADLDTAYTKDGLSRALEQAARNAGVDLQIITIDDTEFPFLLGVKCEEGDFEKAVDWQEKALGLAKDLPKEEAEKARKRLALYREGKPYREE